MSTPTKNPAAVALGKLKRGIKESPSEAKIASNRANGAKGGRPRKRYSKPEDIPAHYSWACAHPSRLAPEYWIAKAKSLGADVRLWRSGGKVTKVSAL